MKAIDIAFRMVFKNLHIVCKNIKNKDLQDRVGHAVNYLLDIKKAVLEDD